MAAGLTLSFGDIEKIPFNDLVQIARHKTEQKQQEVKLYELGIETFWRGIRLLIWHINNTGYYRPSHIPSPEEIVPLPGDVVTLDKKMTTTEMLDFIDENT